MKKLLILIALAQFSCSGDDSGECSDIMIDHSSECFEEICNFYIIHGSNPDAAVASEVPEAVYYQYVEDFEAAQSATPAQTVCWEYD